MAKIKYKEFFMSFVRPKITNEKVVYYLKLYSVFIVAENKLDAPRGIHSLLIANSMTSQEAYDGEEHYIKYLNSIVKRILKNKETIQQILKEDPVADPLRAKSELLMAQNICVMRILKMSK